MSDRKQQADKILAFLEAHPNEWMPVFDLIYVSKSLSHSRRVSDLRKRGFTIENKIEHGHSFYRYTPKAEQLRLIA